MKRTSKWFAIFIILVMILSSLSLLIVKPSFAQSSSKPSVPEFTARVVNASDVPANYWVNPVMNQNMTVLSIYNSVYVIELTIKNQPFASNIYNDGNIDQNVSLFYNVRMKEPSTVNWTVFYDAGLRYPYASKSDYTVMLLPIGNIPVGGGNNTLVPEILRYYWFGQEFISSDPVAYDGKVDFQVEAMIGYVSSLSMTTPFNTEHFVGEISDWSSTQSITIPSSPQSSSPTPTVPELSWLAILPLVVATLFIAAKLGHRKTINSNQ
jgi:hypothetical protein